MRAKHELDGLLTIFLSLFFHSSSSICPLVTKNSSLLSSLRDDLISSQKEKERLDQTRRSLLSSVRSEQAKCALAKTAIEQQRRDATVLAQKLKQCSVHLKRALDNNEELKGVLVDLHEENNQKLKENEELVGTMVTKDAELSKLRSFQHVALRESQMARGILKQQTKDACSATNGGGSEKGDDMEARVFGMDSSSFADMASSPGDHR